MKKIGWKLLYITLMVLFSCIFQVLKAKVLQCDPDKAKMILSFKAAVEGDTEETARPQFDCDVGQVRFRRVFSFYWSFLSNLDSNMSLFV